MTQVFDRVAEVGEAPLGVRVTLRADMFDQRIGLGDVVGLEEHFAQLSDQAWYLLLGRLVCHQLGARRIGSRDGLYLLLDDALVLACDHSGLGVLGGGEVRASARALVQQCGQLPVELLVVQLELNPSPPDPMLHAFGMHVRRIRQDRGITLEALADRSGLSLRGVVYIEHGRRNPSLSSILNLARGLGVAPSRLLSVFDPAPDSPPEPPGT